MPDVVPRSRTRTRTRRDQTERLSIKQRAALGCSEAAVRQRQVMVSDRRRIGSAVDEHIELVAIQIAEVGDVKAITALVAKAGWAFVGAAQLESLLVDAIDLVA